MSTAPSMSPATPKPDHVPDSLVYDFDMFADPGMLAGGHDRALELVKEAPPIFWTPRQGGHWVLAGHNAIFEASRDIDRFSNAMVSYEQIQEIQASMPPDAPKLLIPAPITYDPPHHAVYRSPLQKAFSPKAMAESKESIVKLARDLIEAVKADGHCEFISAVAEPMPVTFFLRIFGLPEEKQLEYRALVKEHFSASTDKDPGRIQARLRHVAAVMYDTIIDRKDNPKDDLISLLWQSEFNGKPATLNDLENYAVMLFTAGLDTVVNGMALGAVHLARDPALQAELRADPSKIPQATEELLRRYTFTVPPRFVREDTEFQGAAMKKGEMAVLMLPTGDLDPSEYPEPEEFRLNREGKAHIAFGAGPHRCLGSHLARIELNIVYEEMLKMLPEFRLDADKPLHYHGGHVWGPEEVHLRWD
ncbi:cytochrome P450 [Mangrovimicrobium sediminis]|uniref:Cytochrome P450 n=1 Tax=Mangrovimicrobium sediminis TaxID=2562682 RepID=A0A4Z0M218_9GAMM|nr:cytochrome P450 [Haliea sp. SAOS-164]TGD73418.1 cytochrome P450 [Haliea sp. SAOS-164]